MKLPGKLPRSLWAADFEFTAHDGERPRPLCMVARELRSGRTLRFRQDELTSMKTAPFPTDRSAVMLAYYAPAEVACMLELGWPIPEYILDLFAEFRVLTNGLKPPCGDGLIGAMVYHGLNSLAVAEKGGMRDLVSRGGPYSEAEKQDILAYCESDVDALERLFRVMEKRIDVPRALLRGRYMAATARIERCGIPIDVSTLKRLQSRSPEIATALIELVDRDYGVFDGTTFKKDRWERWLAQNGIPWPLLESGELALSDDVFKDVSRSFPIINRMRELRRSLPQLRESKLAVGVDGRNRCMLSPFRSKTGRNQPSTARFIFGHAVWFRGLIRPDPGWGLAYLDWSQQETGIAAALSNDAAMLDAYRSGDVYLAFAKQARAAPPDATKKSHAAVREQFKGCALGVLYGMGVDSVALRINQPPAVARDLLDKHHSLYRQFWKWSDAAVDYAMLHNKLHTVFGWSVHVGSDVNPRSLRNFPMQANAAEMLRLACIAATEQGIRVCAPVHDALLIEAPLSELDDAIAACRDIMAEASAIVLGGFKLRTDEKRVLYPDRYMDARGQQMWNAVMGIMSDFTPSEARVGAVAAAAAQVPSQSVRG